MKEGRIKDELSVCLYPLNRKMDAVESALTKKITTFKVHSEPELKALLKKEPIFCIVIGCNISEKEDIIKVLKTCSATPKIPCLMYGHVSEQEFAFQLAKAGLEDFITIENIEQLLEKLHQLIEQATFQIDLNPFYIDLEQTKNYWSRKFIHFITQDYNFLRFSTVSAIVNHLGISLVTLDHAFKEDCSISPKQMQIYLRNYFAAYLLSFTNWTAKKIADQCRFANEHEFYKCFKNRTGITPKQFRQTKLWQDFSALYMENIGQKPQKTNKPAKFITRNDTNNKK